MAESQARPDRRIVHALRAIVSQMPYKEADLHIQNGYLRYAGWILKSGEHIILNLEDNDELVIRSSWLGTETPGVGLTGTNFSSIVFDPSPSRRFAFQTEEELVQTAFELIFNRQPKKE